MVSRRGTQFPWRGLNESPWVDAVYRVVEGREVDTDVAAWVNPRTMPISLLREVLDFIGVPDTSRLSDEFTRRVGQNLYTYFHRNSWAAVDRTARDLQFEYFYTWRHGDVADRTGIPTTQRTAIDFCVTPSPLVSVDAAYADAVREWLQWVLPYLDGSVDCVDGDPSEGVRPRVNVDLCTYVEVPLRMRVAGNVTLIHDPVEAT